MTTTITNETTENAIVDSNSQEEKINNEQHNDPNIQNSVVESETNLKTTNSIGNSSDMDDEEEAVNEDKVEESIPNPEGLALEDSDESSRDEKADCQDTTFEDSNKEMVQDGTAGVETDTSDKSDIVKDEILKSDKAEGDMPSSTTGDEIGTADTANNDQDDASETGSSGEYSDGIDISATDANTSEAVKANTTPVEETNENRDVSPESHGSDSSGSEFGSEDNHSETAEPGNESDKQNNNISKAGTTSICDYEVDNSDEPMKDSSDEDESVVPASKFGRKRNASNLANNDECTVKQSTKRQKTIASVHEKEASENDPEEEEESIEEDDNNKTVDGQVSEKDEFDRTSGTSGDGVSTNNSSDAPTAVTNIDETVEEQSVAEGDDGSDNDKVSGSEEISYEYSEEEIVEGAGDDNEDDEMKQPDPTDTTKVTEEMAATEPKKKELTIKWNNFKKVYERVKNVKQPSMRLFQKCFVDILETMLPDESSETETSKEYESSVEDSSEAGKRTKSIGDIYKEIRKSPVAKVKDAHIRLLELCESLLSMDKNGGLILKSAPEDISEPNTKSSNPKSSKPIASTAKDSPNSKLSYESYDSSSEYSSSRPKGRAKANPKRRNTPSARSSTTYNTFRPMPKRARGMNKLQLKKQKEQKEQEERKRSGW